MKRILTATLTFAISVCAPASAADERFIDFEYLPSSVYSNVIGIGFYHAKEEDFGLFFNVQTVLTSREPKYESLGIYSFGDPITNRYKDLTLINIGGARRLSDLFAGYLGIGYASVRGVAQKYDPSHILGSNGTYYVNDPANDATGMNINAGLLMTFDKVILNAGYHSFAQSINLGIGYKL